MKSASRKSLKMPEASTGHYASKGNFVFPEGYVVVNYFTHIVDQVTAPLQLSPLKEKILDKDSKMR
jgi:hypothetical protein